MILTNVSLKPFNTFGIDVNCMAFATFGTRQELDQLIRANQRKPLLILGGGSNILFTKDYEGLVLKNEIQGIEVKERADDYVIVKAGAGELWHDFVLYCIENNFGGVENLSLIPGSVGASPMQNIGAYGVEIKDVFEELEAYHIESGEIHSFDAAACAFGYRESVFKRALKNQYIIISVSFRLTTQNHQLRTDYGAIQEELAQKGIIQPGIKDISDAVIAIRQSKLPNPKQLGNAGSFFKNPVVSTEVYTKIASNFEKVPHYPAGEGHVKLAAGWLIEQAGWKGFRDQACGVHEKQALVLVNYAEATGNSIFELSSRIISDINLKFNVLLEREVNIM